MTNPKTRTAVFMGLVVEARLVLENIDQLKPWQLLKKRKLLIKYKSLLGEIKKSYPQYLYDIYLL